MADVTIEAALRASPQALQTRGGIVWTSDTTGYAVFVGTSKVSYRKSTDSGATWGSAVDVLDSGETTDGYVFCALWFDQWTSGDSGTKIHICGADFHNDLIRYRTLNTSGDGLGTEVSVGTDYTGATNTIAYNAAGLLSITKARGANLYIGLYADNTATRIFYRSTDNGGTWGTRTTLGEAGEDSFLLLPANTSDNQDICAIYFDDSAHELSVKVYDDSANTWTEVSIRTGIVPTDWNDATLGYGAAVRHSDGHIIVVDWSDINTATADLGCWDVNVNSVTATVSAKTDVVTNTSAIGECDIFINQATDDLYALYARPSGASGDCYYKKSTDGGSTWGTETKFNVTALGIVRVFGGHSVKSGQSGRFMPAWVDSTNADLITNQTNSIAITVSSSFSPIFSEQAPLIPQRKLAVFRDFQQGPLLPLPAPTPGKQFYPEASQLQFPLPRRLRVDRDAGSAMPAPAPVAAPKIPWHDNAPIRLRPVVRQDPGTAISPLTSTTVAWYPDTPEPRRERLRVRDDPGSGLVTPVPSTVVFVQPDAPWTPKKRLPTPDGSGFGEHPLYLTDLSWADPPSDRPAPRRVPVSGDTTLPPVSVGAYDLSWALQQAQVPARRLAREDTQVPVLLPVFQAQAPSWLPRPADVIIRLVRAQDGGSAAALLALSQATDLSWLADPPRPAPRRLPQHVPSWTPQATAVTLSSWGWIPEVPGRPGIKLVSNAPVSVFVPKAIITAMPWGWIPEGPDRGFRRAPATHQDQGAISALSMQALGWLPESPIPFRTRRALDAGSFVLPPQSAVPWGWFTESAQPRRPAFREAPQHLLPLSPLSTMPALWQHWQAFQRPPVPVVSGAHVLPLGALVLTTLPPMPRVEEPRVVMASRSAILAALLSGEALVIAGGGVLGDLRAILVEAMPWRAVLGEEAWRAVLDEVEAWRAILKE